MFAAKLLRIPNRVRRQILFCSYSTTTRYNMASSIKPTATITHVETSSPTIWKEALIASGSAPKSFEIIKTLVYKPKTAKNATPIPVVVIARDDTETNAAAIGKKLNLKELRLASGDLLTEFFSLDKNSCTS
jgi:prolyl-tRNA synthetase